MSKPCREHQRVSVTGSARPPDGFDSPCSLTLAGRLNQLVEGRVLAGRFGRFVEGKCVPTDKRRGEVRDGSAARPGTFRGRFEHAVTLEA